MTETALADEIIKLALELQRVSSYEEARADAILAQLEQDLRQLLATRDLSASSRREIEAIIKQANEAIAGRFANIQGILDVEKLIETVSNRTVEAMAAAGIPTTAPTAETLRSLSQSILIEGSPLAAWWDKQADDTAFRFAGAVRNGVLLGETNEQIVRRVAGEQGVIGLSRRNARTLVHSSIMTAANRARLETFRKNAKFAAGVSWLATLDSSTCMRCAALDGKGWDFDGNPIGHKLQFQVPALHANCFPADALVSPIGLIEGASKRWFDGEMAVIKTASGRNITCTPNHPILTDRGWVAAGLIDVGSNIVCDSRSDRGGLVGRNGDDIPTSIHDVAESFFSTSGMVPVPVPVSPEDFHGDGNGSDIAIVGANRLLGKTFETPFSQHFEEGFLVSGGRAGLVDLARSSAEAEFIEGHSSAFSGGMSSSDLGFALAGAHAAPTKCLGFGLASPSDTRLLQNQRDNHASGVVLPGNSALGHPTDVIGADAISIDDSSRAGWYFTTLQFTKDDAVADPSLAADFSSIQPGDVERDTVVERSFIGFSGHVYNLETSTGLYIAQGAITHNCRCVLSVIPSRKALDEIFPGLADDIEAARDRATAQGPQKVTMTEWLQRNADAAEEILGKRRVELFKKGELTLSELVTKGGRQKTLAELNR